MSEIAIYEKEPHPFEVDVRVPLPAACPDCGGDVLTCADLDASAKPDEKLEE